MRASMFLSVILVAALALQVSAGTITGTVKVKGAKHGGDAVIYVDKIEGKTFKPSKEHVVMDQKDVMFVPHVLPVLAGTTVDFLNSDPVLHNVFTPDKCADKFNLGSWPQGKVRSYAFEKECVAVVLCNVHPEMEAFILTLPTPYFAVTDKSGAFRIANVPDGTYTLRAWHPKLKEASQEVSVSGDSTVVGFELKK